MEELLPLNIERLKYVAKSNEKRSGGHLKNSVMRAKRIIKILERDNYSCVECKSKEKLTIEHPEGRKFARWNNHQKYCLNKCVTLCVKCHSKRNNDKLNKKI